MSERVVPTKRKEIKYCPFCKGKLKKENGQSMFGQVDYECKDCNALIYWSYD